MAGANYEWCSVCDSKALYVGEDDTPNVVVLHLKCWRQVCVAAGFPDNETELRRIISATPLP